MNLINLTIVFVAVFIITPLIRKIALTYGITDNAGGDLLKIHKEPVALLGGAGILVAAAIGIVVPFKNSLLWSSLCPKELISIVVGGLIVFGVGLWDDIWEVKPIFRFLIHILTGAIILLAGLKMNFVPIWWIFVPFTIIYVAGAINAFNVIDGMDGLCSGIALISCIGYFFLGLKSSNALMCSLSAILFMALLGFLPYNFYPAKIFLGDAGSGFLGFILGVMAVMATSKAYDKAGFIASILIIGLPVFDMAFAIVRRLMQRKPLFVGDRDHVYDLLLKKGRSQPKAWVIMCGIQSVFVGIAIVFF